MNPKRLLLVAGARPNFMKIAPLIHAIERHNAESCNGEPSSTPGVRSPLRGEDQGEGLTYDIEFKLVHTGQHYDPQMSQIFFEQLRIPLPNVSLDVGSGSHAVQTARVMERFEPVCAEYLPDWLIVVGDVNSTMACALVASKLGIKVAHVEAGLRSFDRTMPEEINRVVTDALADLLLTPSEDANENLRREGIPEKKIRLVGNIMIDSLVENLRQARSSPILNTHHLTPGQFVYVTLHRPSNVDHPESLSAIMAELQKLAGRMPVVFPMHPRTRKMIEEFGISSNGVAGLKVVEPIGYHDSLCLTESARLVLTDSGGLQEESTFFRTPCLTLRPNTERPITITMGSNRLTARKQLSEDIQKALAADDRRDRIPPLWDGHTAERIIGCFCSRA